MLLHCLKTQVVTAGTVEELKRTFHNKGLPLEASLDLCSLALARELFRCCQNAFEGNCGGMFVIMYYYQYKLSESHDFRRGLLIVFRSLV